MMLDVKKGDTFIFSKDIMYSYHMYMSNDGFEPAMHSLADCYRNHAVYGEITDVTVISDQFIEIIFQPVSKLINGDAQYCKFIVYDDSVVHLPEKYQNYITKTFLLKSMIKASPEVEILKDKIENNYKDQKSKLFGISLEITGLKMKYDLLKDEYDMMRSNMAKDYVKLLDEHMFNVSENRAYQKELVTYVDKTSRKNNKVRK